jgi:hypothetical protein
MLSPGMRDILYGTGNIERISKKPSCEIEEYMRDTILLNKTKFSVSQFNIFLQEANSVLITRLLKHFDDLDITLSTVYKRAMINPLILRDNELQFHVSILDGKMNKFVDFLVSDHSSISQSSFPFETTSVSTPWNANDGSFCDLSQSTCETRILTPNLLSTNQI